jgi:hypothetical protein
MAITGLLWQIYNKGKKEMKIQVTDKKLWVNTWFIIHINEIHQIISRRELETYSYTKYILNYISPKLFSAYFM